MLALLLEACMYFKVGPFCIVRDCMCYCAEHDQHA